MYLLLDGNRPFAILESKNKIPQAVTEEFLYEQVSLVGDVRMPNWGQSSTIKCLVEDEFGEKDVIELTVTKLVKY